MQLKRYNARDFVRFSGDSADAWTRMQQFQVNNPGLNIHVLEYVLSTVGPNVRELKKLALRLCDSLECKVENLEEYLFSLAYCAKQCFYQRGVVFAFADNGKLEFEYHKNDEDCPPLSAEVVVEIESLDAFFNQQEVVPGYIDWSLGDVA